MQNIQKSVGVPQNYTSSSGNFLWCPLPENGSREMQGCSTLPGGFIQPPVLTQQKMSGFVRSQGQLLQRGNSDLWVSWCMSCLVFMGTSDFQLWYKPILDYRYRFADYQLTPLPGYLDGNLYLRNWVPKHRSHSKQSKPLKFNHHVNPVCKQTRKM